MRISETKYLQSSRADIAEEEGLDIELAAFHAKLAGGGDLCHRIGAILAFACTESKRCHTHILGQLQVNNSGISGKTNKQTECRLSLSNYLTNNICFASSSCKDGN